MNTARRARKSVDVMISGRGSNMEALVIAAMNPDFPARINRVISNRADAEGLKIAEKHGIAGIAVDHREFDDRPAHEAALMKLLDAGKPDLICLAGYMRILSGDFVHHYEGRIINIHPSLLPAFRGIDTHERALAAGVRVHGASVHFVTEGVDEGPVIAQAAVPVLAEDDAQSLSERVLAVEHRLYPHALALVAGGTIRYGRGRAARSTAVGDASAVLFSPPLP